ncbi:MAG: DUF5020 family protein [Bacteroidales bacterium]|nr:DUF5020 family protein [Bacteroidales bacterium]
MKTRTIIIAAALALISTGLKAQTNLQTFYDFGKDRGHFTTTLEGFYNDDWGNTFFFIDYDFNGDNSSWGGGKHLASGSYMEIARCLNFWQDTKAAPLSLQVEYNGGIGFPSQNFLFGLDYFLHSADFNNTFNFKLLFKTFSKGTTSNVPLQFTFVWGMQDIFGVEGLRFSGFCDLWGENVVNFAEDITRFKEDKFVFLSEPQLWYNLGRHFGCDNFHIGTEVELSVNFAGYHGFYARPCLGTKWVF